MSDMSSQSPRPMWRHPIWLLVIGGPLVVVVASIITAVIAARGQDEVLDTRKRIKAEAGSDEVSASKERTQMPAMAGRNHAVSPNPAQAAGGTK